MISDKCSCVHTCTHTHTHTRTHAHMYAHMHACTHTHTHAHMYAHMHACMHAHTHTHARTHARTHAHTHKHAHTHNCACVRCGSKTGSASPCHLEVVWPSGSENGLDVENSGFEYSLGQFKREIVRHKIQGFGAEYELSDID